jgi:hypothetical protein
MPYTCLNCSTVFGVKSDYGKHSKQCLKTTETFEFNTQSITIHKNSEDHFNCYCSDAGCADGKKSYKNIENMKRHMRKAKSHWLGKVNH